MIGVLYYEFSRAIKFERLNTFGLLNKDQIRWVSLSQMLIDSEPDLESLFCPETKCLQIIYEIVKSVEFDIFTLVCVLLNIVVLALPYNGMSTLYAAVVAYSHNAFVAIFIIEALLKIISLGFIRYIINPWNKYDLLTVFVSIASFLMNFILGEKTKNINIYAEIFLQFFRIARIIKLQKSFKYIPGLQGI